MQNATTTSIVQLNLPNIGSIGKYVLVYILCWARTHRSARTQTTAVHHLQAFNSARRSNTPIVRTHVNLLKTTNEQDWQWPFTNSNNINRNMMPNRPDATFLHWYMHFMRTQYPSLSLVCVCSMRSIFSESLCWLSNIDDSFVLCEKWNCESTNKMEFSHNVFSGWDNVPHFKCVRSHLWMCPIAICIARCVSSLGPINLFPLWMKYVCSPLKNDSDTYFKLYKV